MMFLTDYLTSLKYFGKYIRPESNRTMHIVCNSLKLVEVNTNEVMYEEG